MIDKLGDRIKLYESLACPDRLMPGLPIIIRADGVAFHTFTKGLKRPYDEGLSNLMIATTEFLVAETNARCGYTQSDEISLLLYADTHKSQIFFDGRIQKIQSVLAARASVFFNKNLAKWVPSKVNSSPEFDCRIFTVPSKEEAVNVFWWREKDATKNSISMAAQAYYSHNELQNKNSSDKQELLFQKGINWNDYPAFFKRGTYVQKRLVMKPFSKEEIESLPEKHAARTNPNLEILRSDVKRLSLPPLMQVENKIEVIFEGKEPIQLKTKKEN